MPVDAYFETCQPVIFAAGDIAVFPDPVSGEPLRIEHWVTAERQGQVAAANMVGQKRRFTAVPFFWTEQFGVALRYVGHASRWDKVEIDGDVDRGDFIARYYDQGEHGASAAIGRDLDILEDEREFEQKIARSLAAPEPPDRPDIQSATMSEEAPMEFSEFGSFPVTSADDVDDYRPSTGPTRSDIKLAVRTLIAAAGDDPDREGLRETPSRVARAYKEWFAGYEVDPQALLSRVFVETEGYDETVLLRDIPLVSTCEHHLAPITGKAHLAYRPNGKVVGISKLSRLVDAYARRLQLQERLTSQIAQALETALQPKGVAVIIEATHGCMSTRGVNQHGISMVTKAWRGEFKSDPHLRRELLDAVHACAAR